MAETTADIARLLAHTDWLHGLARRLVGEAAADDVVQETFIAAMRSPPDPDRAPRPWLARVLRNITRMRFRSDTRRTAREDASANVEIESPTSDEAIQRLETHRMLCELVLGLDEPLRHTMIHHYFDDLTMAEIARKDRVPETTVRSRHKQALERLRMRLDERSGGDRRAWVGSVATIASAPSNTPWLVLGGGLLVKKLVIGVIVIAVGALAWNELAARPVADLSQAGMPAGSGATPAEHVSAGKSTATATRHVTRLASMAERQRMTAQIALAQSKRNALASAPSLPEAATMSKTTIRNAMREVIPYVQECYEHALSSLSSPNLVIMAHLVLHGDPDIGTLVDAPQLVDDHDQPLPTELDDCLRSTFQLLELPPLAEGDELDVNYPLRFESVAADTIGSAANAAGSASSSGWRSLGTRQSRP